MDNSNNVTSRDFVIQNDRTLNKYVGTANIVTVPEGILDIGPFAFRGLDVEEVVLPDGLKHIQNNAFDDCYRLTKVTIPNSVEFISDCAFNGCISLKRIYFEGTMDRWNERKRKINRRLARREKLCHTIRV